MWKQGIQIKGKINQVLKYVFETHVCKLVFVCTPAIPHAPTCLLSLQTVAPTGDLVFHT